MRATCQGTHLFFLLCVGVSGSPAAVVAVAIVAAIATVSANTVVVAKATVATEPAVAAKGEKLLAAGAVFAATRAVLGELLEGAQAPFVAVAYRGNETRAQKW